VSVLSTTKVLQAALDGIAKPTSNTPAARHQPVISPSSARHQPPWLSAPHREPINVWSGRHTSGDCFSEALSNIPKTAKTNTAAMARNIHEIWIVLYCATLFWKRLTAV